MSVMSVMCSPGKYCQSNPVIIDYLYFSLTAILVLGVFYVAENDQFCRLIIAKIRNIENISKLPAAMTLYAWGHGAYLWYFAQLLLSVRRAISFRILVKFYI